MRNMITLLRSLIFVTVLCTVTLSQTIAVQGILRDPSGKTAQDGNYTLTFRLYNSDTGGGDLWTEAHPSVPVKHGVYAVELGTITNFDNLTFSEQYYIGVTVGAGNELTPRVKLTTSPTSMAVFGKDNIFPSSGKVGVGTITPTALLHIEQTNTTDTTDLLIIDNGTNTIEVSSDGVMHIPSSIQFNDGTFLSTAQGSSASSLSSSGDAIIATDNDEDGTGDILLRTGQNTQMVIKNDGKVGIGTTTPSANLEVEGETIFNGNVGIGLTSPNYKLDVEGHTGLNGILYMNANEAAAIMAPNAYLDLRSNHDLYGVLIRKSTEDLTWGNIEVNDGNLGFSYQSSTPHMVIATGGNVGIGTTTPSRSLEVVGRVRSSGSIAGLEIDDGTSTPWGIVNDFDEDLSFWNDVYRMTISSNGNVGIGTITPSAPLDIKSAPGGTLGWSSWPETINLRDSEGVLGNEGLATIQGPGHLFIGFHGVENKFYFGDNSPNQYFGTAGSGGFATYSDRRLKKNIKPLKNVINKVKAINGVTYEWDWDEPEKDKEGNVIRHLGVIAQDVEKQFPELVETNMDGMLGVNYGGLSAVLIEAFKEQQGIIETQANELEDLKARLARIEAKLK
ncbi:MAG: tail fiber domain-containing protein [Candidatus Marinimicrobia bacterium]|nr:tail fiber domain-containing protein [Candidatus Neomarinimicrobiota bacterium]